MKKTNVMALALLIVFTSASAEADVFKDHITKLENNAVKVVISGVVEVGYDESRTVKKIQVDTVELGIIANLTKNFSANLFLLSEAGDNGNLPTNQLVDKATLNGSIKGIDFSVGRLTVPFGVYETAMISDIAGLDIGEIGADALVLSTKINGVILTVWSGNSKNSGFGISYEGENYAVGIDTIRDAATDASGNNTDTINNKGVAIHGQVSFGGTTIIVEQVKVDGDTTVDEKGKLTQVELNHTIGDWTFAVSQNKGTTTGGTKNNTKTNAYAVTYNITEGVNLTAESSKLKGAKSSILAKLSYEF